MSDNIVPDLLRAIRGDIAELRLDVRELKERVTTPERQVGQLAANEQSHYAALMGRFDRVESRVERIERRLDLLPAGG